MINSSRRCAACKYLRRRCPLDCIFSPYFPPNNPQRFASVHKIFGASNVAKMLKQLPVHQRTEAVDSLFFEAQNRIHDPVYGCVPIISFLQNEIRSTEQMLAMTRAEITLCQQANLQVEQVEAGVEFDSVLQSQGQGASYVDQSALPGSTWNAL